MCECEERVSELEVKGNINLCQLFWIRWGGVRGWSVGGELALIGVKAVMGGGVAWLVGYGWGTGWVRRTSAVLEKRIDWICEVFCT